jgi:hypothetical protein
MVTQRNETCIELNGVVLSGFSERSNTIYIKGTWYPMHFLLLITDGIDAWRIDATENVVTLRARSLQLTESEYVDKAHSYLGQQHASSLYSLHRTSSEAVQLMCTPTDKQYTVGFNLELILKKVPAVSITFDMLQFLMQAHRDVLEQSEYKTRMFERTKAVMEKTIVELQKEKHEMESELLQLKTGEEEEEGEEDDDDVGAMTVISAAAAKRKKGEHTVEKKGASVRKKPLWSFSVPSPPSLSPPPPATSKALPSYTNGSKEISKSGSKARRGIMKPTKIISKQSVSETKYGNSWGAQPAKFSVVGAAGGHSEEHQTAEEEDDEDDEGEEEEDKEDKEEEKKKTGRVRHKKMIIAHANVEGSQFAAGDLAFTEQHYQLMNANKGRRATGSTKEGSRSTASHSKVMKGDGSRSAAISISKKKGGDIVVSADPIEEQAVKGIKPLVPLRTSGSTGGQDGEKKKRRSRSDEKIPNPSKKRGRPSDPGSQHKQSSEKKKAGSLQWISCQAESPEANSRSPNASLVHVTDDVDQQQPFGVLENNNNSLAIMPVNHEQKKFNVISADIHDFDSDRTEKVMALHQFWALYDDKDGMPRFYGHITKLRHSPFEVNVEWLEPYRPVVRRSGLVKSAALSASCGEFVLATECSQTLAAFSHRVEIEEDVSRGTFQLYPKKGEVWALYRNWSKPKPEKVADVAVDEEEDNVKFEYELVEVHSDYSKEKGVKVAPIYKVSGFTALFKSGGYRASIAIPAKDVPSRFSHRIFTYQISGDEKPGVPKDSLELDPAATPLEYLQQSPNGYGDGVDNVPAPEVEALQTVSESG